MGQVDVSTHDEVPLFGGARAERLRRRRKLLVAGGALLALILVAGTIFVLTQRNVTTEVSLDQVVEEFREEHSAEQGEVAEAPSSRKNAEGEASADAAAPAAEEAARPTTQSAAVQKESDAVPYGIPAEGVYSYRTTGGERLSTFGASHDYPSRTFATVRHLEGCVWEQRNDVIEEHVDIRKFCATEGLLEQLRYEAQITFFGQTDGAAVTCDPPMVMHSAKNKPGDQARFVCTDGEGSTSRITLTFVGIESVDVGGETVKANKIEIEGSISGRIEGTSFDSLWLHPMNGLTVRWERKNDNLATAYGARVRYQEEATFVLESLDPAR